MYQKLLCVVFAVIALALLVSSEIPHQVVVPHNPNHDQRIIELLLVVDNKIFNRFDKNMTEVHQYCKDLTTYINAHYSRLNISVALTDVVAWTDQNLADLSSDADRSLRSFLNYRRRYLVEEYPNHDHAHLLTGEIFDGGVFGKSLKGPICTAEYSGGISMVHSENVKFVAATVVHELGHTLGIEHDTDRCACPDDRCIMSSLSSFIIPTHWSSCSIDQLQDAFSHGMDHCLKNNPEEIFGGPVCGNGFLELGEECDCGLPEYCDNSCCNSNTCKLQSFAACASGSCCDLTTCKPYIAGRMCRQAVGECDLAEYCSGDQEFCPNDVYKQDGKECKNGEAFCYQGSCQSHDDQCKVLWGPTGSPSELCYTRNTNGTRHGNCGYERIKKEYKKCGNEDIKCGMLQCQHSNERLEYGLESVSILSHSFINVNGKVTACRTAKVDLGIQAVDPGLTPNGAKCGDGKMCVDQKCISVESIKTGTRTTAIANCPECGASVDLE